MTSISWISQGNEGDINGKPGMLKADEKMEKVLENNKKEV